MVEDHWETGGAVVTAGGGKEDEPQRGQSTGGLGGQGSSTVHAESVQGSGTEHAECRVQFSATPFHCTLICIIPPSTPPQL